MENRTKQSIRPMDNNIVGDKVNGNILHRVLAELAPDISLIETASLKAMLSQFRVSFKSLEQLNADLKIKNSNYELIEFTTDQLEGLQIAIVPHGKSNDNDILTFVAEEANRPDLLSSEG